ncbi:hypothetical protein ACOSOMT5_P0999 [Acidiphilium sp. MT5]
MKIALKTIAAGSLLVALAGCTVQNLPNGGVALNPVPMGQIFATGQPQGPIGPTPFPTQIGVPQNYAGYLEGGNGSMTMTKRGQGTYFVSVSVSSNVGAGQVEGYAYRRGNQLIMTQGFESNVDTQPEQCDLSFTPQGNNVSVGETNCSYFHGAQVSFNGVLSRVN